MDGNATQQLQIDSSEMQQTISRVMSEAIRSLPRPKVPLWMEAIVDFIKFHPWLSLLIFIFVIFVISAIIREVICSYLKTNDILIRLKRIEEKLK
ncbi:MAG: hypothetical protein AAB213_01585 [Candidatus Omnitrophota bacterium]